MEEKHRGAYSELKAAAWLLEQGFDVFRNVSPYGKVDLVAIKDGVIRCFDVKTSYRGGCINEGVEHLSAMADGSFKIMGARRPRSQVRPATPREIVLQKLATGLDA